MSGLPKEWTKTTVGELADSIQYGHTASSTSEQVGPRFLRITDIQENRVDWETVPFCQIPQNQIPKYRLAKGDLVFARTGATVGKSFLIQTEIPESIFASYLIRVRVTKAIEARYLYYFFQSSDYWHQISDSSSGIGQPNVNGTKLAAITLPIAPFPEQRRIVARIEELFSRLDAGVAALRHAKAQLQRYRQSVLTAAVTGQLTQAWREKHPDTEPAVRLLERILEQRRQQWNGRGKYKEPKGIDAGDFTPLPEGWVWSSGEQHFDWSSGKGLTKKEQQPGEVPVIGGNGVLGTHSEANVMTPTIVVGRVGAQCGNIYRTTEPAWITDNAIYATFVPVAICLPFIEMAFRAANLNSRAGGSGQPFVNQGTLNELEIALPPLAEQHQIVAEVEARTTAIDHLEAELDRQITRANRLRQSALASAFSGQLR